MEGYLAGTRLQNLAGVPIHSFNSALMSFAAQNTGARDEKRVKRGTYYTVAMSVGMMLVIIAIIYPLAPQLVALFGVSGQAISLGVEQIRYILPMMLIFAVYIPVSGMLRGVGDAVVSSAITLLALIINVSCAYLFVGTAGYSAPWSFTPIAWSSALILACGYYFSGRWRRKAIILAQTKHSK